MSECRSVSERGLPTNCERIEMEGGMGDSRLMRIVTGFRAKSRTWVGNSTEPDSTFMLTIRRYIMHS